MSAQAPVSGIEYFEALSQIFEDHSKAVRMPGWNDESRIQMHGKRLTLFIGNAPSKCLPRDEEVRSSDWIIFDNPPKPEALSREGGEFDEVAEQVKFEASYPERLPYWWKRLDSGKYDYWVEKEWRAWLASARIAHTELTQARKRIAELEAASERLSVALNTLLNAARLVSDRGASTGPQWITLSSGITHARATLANKTAPQPGEG